jgi:hypothetical protein
MVCTWLFKVYRPLGGWLTLIVSSVRLEPSRLLFVLTETDGLGALWLSFVLSLRVCAEAETIVWAPYALGFRILRKLGRFRPLCYRIDMLSFG